MMNSDLSAHTSHGPYWLRSGVSSHFSHINHAEKVKTGPGSASVTILASCPCSQSGCQGWGSERDVWWLSDRQETLLSPGLSGCMQRRWREHRRIERPFYRHCIRLLLVSCRCTHNQIKATWQLPLILQVKLKFHRPKNSTHIMRQDARPVCQTVPHLSGVLAFFISPFSFFPLPLFFLFLLPSLSHWSCCFIYHLVPGIKFHRNYE